MDDCIGFRFEHGAAHGVRVEQIERNRLHPERANAFGVFGRSVRADYFVPSLEELRNEPAADRAARPCHEDSHRFSFKKPMRLADTQTFEGDVILLTYEVVR